MIGIRREDKLDQERRAPLAPIHIMELIRDFNLTFAVESSKNRIFTDEEYRDAGAEIVDELPDSCSVILGVKEIPLNRLHSGKPHIFFSHVIKGQSYNMPLLQRMLYLKNTLIDYETITDEHDRRLIFFGVQAGQAGMVNTLWSLGQRWKHFGYDTPFASLKQALEYESLDAAKEAIVQAGEEIKKSGLPKELVPCTCGITGYGRVSEGSQEIYDILDPVKIAAKDMLDENVLNELPPNRVYKIVYREEDLVELKPGFRPTTEEEKAKYTFDVSDYYKRPNRYQSIFTPHLKNLTMLVNAIYWTPSYPRFVTVDALKQLFEGTDRPKLTVIGDVTCDIEGSIESTIRAATPDNPVFTFNPEDRSHEDTFTGPGMQMMTVDILPAEIPRESTLAFGDMLAPYLPAIADTDFSEDLRDLSLPLPIRKAVITHKGELTPEYEYLRVYLDKLVSTS